MKLNRRRPKIPASMVPSASSLLLWLTLVLCAPVPFFLVETGYQPIAALAQLLGVMLVLIATEGSSGAVTVAAWMLGVQILLGLFVLAMLTTVVIRVFRRNFGARTGFVTGVLVALIVALAVTQPIYRTPFRAGGLQASLGQVFE